MKKTTFFAKNLIGNLSNNKIQGRLPPLPTPMFGREDLSHISGVSSFF